MAEGAAETIRSVAVIGVGSMGAPMAAHARRAGFALTLCDANREALATFPDADVRTTTIPAECAGCDVALILVATPEQLRTVTVGENGLARIPPRGLPRYIVVASTVSPDDMAALAGAFADLPVRIVDAPVSGGVVAARKATLTFLVGGDEAGVAALRPLFEAMGQAVFHCGPVGAGQITKAINNIVAITNLMVSAEAYAIALANGLTLDRLLPALESGSARNFLSRDANTPPEVYAAWSGTQREFDGVQTINRKDIDLALRLTPGDLPVPTIAALRRLLDATGAETLENWRRIARLGCGR